MEKTRRETLNEIYSPLCERMRALSAALAERGLPAESGWFSGHYSKDETGQYRMDDFPIPVVTVPGRWDIELGLELTTVSAKLRRPPPWRCPRRSWGTCPSRPTGWKIICWICTCRGRISPG